MRAVASLLSLTDGSLRNFNSGRTGAGAVLRGVLIGTVPDRGGRVTEARGEVFRRSVIDANNFMKQKDGGSKGGKGGKGSKGGGRGGKKHGAHDQGCFKCGGSHLARDCTEGAVEAATSARPQWNGAADSGSTVASSVPSAEPAEATASGGKKKSRSRVQLRY